MAEEKISKFQDPLRTFPIRQQDRTKQQRVLVLKESQETWRIGVERPTSRKLQVPEGRIKMEKIYFK